MSALQRVQQAAQQSKVHTVEELRRWSVGDQELPKKSDVKHIHVYDFDNTLFASPTPNRQLWSGSTIGLLQGQDVFKDGGWWHDASLLASIGEGAEKEEKKAWAGWWNEQIVELVQLTMQQNDALCVLLTGRSESGFMGLLKRMVQAKGLQFDLICLKPGTGPSGQRFSSTMVYKQAFLSDLVRTYREAVEIRIYEDRPKHVTGFRDFLRSLNKGLLADDILDRRPPIKGEVIEVSEKDVNLDPMTEVAEIQRMINAHNVAYRNGELPNRAKPWHIKRGNPVYTGHLLSAPDTSKLLDMANLSRPDGEAKGTRVMGNNILIAPGAAYPERLQGAGGMGAKIRWRTVALGSVRERDIEVWAMQVEPVGSQFRPMTYTTPPSVVLAFGKRAKPADVKLIKTWQPIPQEDQHDFDTVVGEKVILSIEEEPQPRRNAPQANDERGSKRQYGEINNDQAFPPLPPASHTRQQYGQRQPPQSGPTSFEAFKATASAPQFHGSSRGGHGGGHNGANRGRGGGPGGGGGRGGGQSNYKPADAGRRGGRGGPMGGSGGLSY